MRDFRYLFGIDKVVLGMIHLAGNDVDRKVSRALEEIRLYEKEGLDGAIIEDYHGDLDDLKATLEEIDWGNTRIKIGINALRSIPLAFEWASTYGARFVQVDSINPRDLNLYNFSLAKYEELRKKHDDIVVLGGISFKYKTQSTKSKLEEDLKEATTRCEAIVTTGEGTGYETPMQKLLDFRKHTREFPLIVGSGVTLENVQEQFSVVDGAIVGSYFKNGKTNSELDKSRIREFMKKVKTQT